MRKNARKGIPAGLGRNIPESLWELRRVWELRKAFTQYLLAKAEILPTQKRKPAGGGRHEKRE